ncbi:MAG: IPT/TIG domain-containing protein [Acidobacteria bacterium]|nr:IPT/TIG domain-containing protein [Acidobacteriota bacterium]
MSTFFFHKAFFRLLSGIVSLMAMLCFSIEASAQSVVINSVNPSQVNVGQVPAKVVIKGTGFTPQSTVFFNDVQVTAKVKKSGKKIVVTQLPAELFQVVGAIQVRVIPPSGAPSNTFMLAVGSLNRIQVAQPGGFSLAVGEQFAIQAQVLDQLGNPVPGAQITYASLNPEKATVDATGVVRGLANGVGTIRLTSGDAFLNLIFTVTEVASIPSGIVGDGDLKVDANNQVYATDLRNHVVKSAAVGEPLRNYAGSFGNPGNVDGPLSSSKFNGPLGLGLGKDRQIFLVDTANRKIRRFSPATGQVETLLDQESARTLGGVETWGPRGVVQTPDGLLYITDADNHVVWKAQIDGTKSLSVIAGGVGVAGLVDGPGNSARFNGPQDLVTGTTPTVLVVSDRGNKVVRLVTLPAGEVLTVGAIPAARQSNTTLDPQQNPTGVSFSDPSGLDVDLQGNIYVADGNTVKIVGSQGQNFAVAELAQTGTFQNAVAIAISGTTAYVLDAGRQQVIRVGFQGTPTITSITPSQVKLGENTEVKIQGTNFLPETQVVIDGIPAREVEVESATEIEFRLPPISQAGTYPVVVSHRGGRVESTITIGEAPSFGISASPEEVELVAGMTAQVTINLQRRNFTGPITLQLDRQLLVGVAATFSPNIVTGNSATMTLSALPGIIPGEFKFRVLGTAPGLVASTEIEVKIRPAQPGQVQLSASPVTQTLRAGERTQFTIFLNRDNFAGEVELEVENEPDGIDARIQPEKVTGTTATLEVETSNDLSPGAYTLLIKGEADGAAIFPTRVQVIIENSITAGTVLLSASPVSQAVQPGGVVSYDIFINRTNYSGEVRLSVSGLPSGIEAEFGDDSPDGNQTPLRLTTLRSVSPGAYVLTVEGDAGDAFVQPTQIELIVESEGSGDSSVSLSASPTTQTIQRSGEGQYIIFLNRNGYFGEVNLSVTGAPTGVEAELDPDSVFGDQTTLFVSAESEAAPGTYVLTIAGASNRVQIDPIQVMLIVEGSGGGSNGSVRISASPVLQSIQPGDDTTYTLFLTRTNFDGEVDVTVTGAPFGVEAEADPDSVEGDVTQLIVTSDNSVAPGTYTLHIEGAASGATVIGTQVQLVIGNGGGGTGGTVTLSASPTSQTIRPGEDTSYTIFLSRVSYTGEVNLTVTGAPFGVEVEANPDSVIGNSTTLVVTSEASAAPGTYSLRITGTANGATVIATQVQLIIDNGGGGSGGTVTLSASPSSQTIAPGDDTSYTIFLNRNNFSGEVNLTVTGAPFGVEAEADPDSVFGNSTTLNVFTETSAAPGTYTLRIEGNASGATVTGTQVQLVIGNGGGGTGGTVTLSASPGSQTIAPGDDTSYTILLNRNNFSGEVNLTVTGAPFGVEAEADPDSVLGNSTRLVVTSESSAASGTYILRIEGTASGATVVATQVQLIIGNGGGTGGTVTLSASPTSQTIPQGEDAGYTIFISRSNFPGTVTLGVSGVPDGVTTEFSPASTTGNSSVLTVVVSADAVPGAYMLTIQGTATGVAINPIQVELVIPGGSNVRQVILSASPASQTVNVGGSTTYTVFLTRTNATGEVNLFVDNVPDGVEAEFTNDSPTGNTTQLQISVENTAQPGTYVLIIGGEATGAEVISTQVTLIIQR